LSGCFTHAWTRTATCNASTDREQYFDLLRAIGGECAGDLSILPLDRQQSAQRQYRPLTEKDLANLAARRGRIYAAWPADERPRLSLARARDECDRNFCIIWSKRPRLLCWCH
jgi:hypothetical protein